MNEDFRQTVAVAAKRPEVCAAIAEVYERLQAVIEQRKPICQASGRCCRFDDYGHRLYVTTMEMASFMASFSSAVTQHHLIHQSTSARAPGGCPYQQDHLCSVYPHRPFGCRIYFCDPSARVWQQELYERFHTEIKRLHGQMDVPYFYMEWRGALGEFILPQGEFFSTKR
jgi:Fe-S-cluster containining protein